jgi:hypothetical protein
MSNDVVGDEETQQSQRARSPVWYVPFDIRPERLHASTALGHLSNSQEEKDATPPSLALPRE